MRDVSCEEMRVCDGHAVCCKQSAEEPVRTCEKFARRNLIHGGPAKEANDFLRHLVPKRVVG